MISGITGLGDVRKLGRLGGFTVLYYAATTGIAVALGIIVVNIIQPGVVEGSAQEVFGLHEDTAALQENLADKGNGNYAFNNLQPGTYEVAEFLQPGWQQTYPSSGYQLITLVAGQVQQGG